MHPILFNYFCTLCRTMVGTVHQTITRQREQQPSTRWMGMQNPSHLIQKVSHCFDCHFAVLQSFTIWCRRWCASPCSSAIALTVTSELPATSASSPPDVSQQQQPRSDGAQPFWMELAKRKSLAWSDKTLEWRRDNRPETFSDGLMKWCNTQCYSERM